MADKHSPKTSHPNHPIQAPGTRPPGTKPPSTKPETKPPPPPHHKSPHHNARARSTHALGEESNRSPIAQIYDALFRAYGPQGWWPGDTPVEIVIGAILTQNTAWTNVEKAIAKLKCNNALCIDRIAEMDLNTLGDLIRPSGTYRVKARRLQAFTRWVVEVHRGNLKRALRGDLQKVREDLLAIHGIGPETADAILLYAGNHASFVIDAYTLRVLRRHHMIDKHAAYADVKTRFETELPPDVQLFNEYHALIVAVGKRHCRTQADCGGCPLARSPHDERR